MQKPMSITFLGTSSGGGPTLSRICSSLSLNLGSASWQQLWIAQRPHSFSSRGPNDSAKWVDGIVPFMSNAMSRIYSRDGDPDYLDNMLRLEIYGPVGIRKLIRTNLQITRTLLRGKYTAHELLSSHDTNASCDAQELHENELAGRDIWMDNDGFWRNFEDSLDMQVDAGPIIHRVPCIGYIFKERPQSQLSEDYLQSLDAIPTGLLPSGMANPDHLLSTLKESQAVTLNDGTVVAPPPRDIPGRKIVVLGDTSDPWAIAPLAHDASLLVHEATNAWLPPALEKGRDKDPDTVRQKAISRGHSTPVMAGNFAKAIRARRLVLNHFSVKYPDPGPKYRSGDSLWAKVIREIERQASQSWKMGEAVAAHDLLVIDIAAHEPSKSF